MRLPHIFIDFVNLQGSLSFAFCSSVWPADYALAAALIDSNSSHSEEDSGFGED